MKSFLNFIQYHNGTLVIAILIVGFGGSVFAATEVTKQLTDSNLENSLAEEKIRTSDVHKTRTSDVLVANTEVAEAVDVSALLSADLDRFDFDLEIVASEEDDTAYKITYTYNTFSLVERTWQEIKKEDTIFIEKKALLGQTLEAHALLQLQQVVEKERAYLRNVQEQEHNTLEERTKSMGRNTLAGLSLSALAEEAVVEREVIEQKPTPEPVTLLGTTEDAVQNDNQSTTVNTNTNTNTNTIASTTTPVATTTSSSTPSNTQTADETAPVLTLIGDEEVVLIVAETYSEEGANAIDDVEGNISAAIVVTGTVDTGSAGTYTVTYTVSDTVGNEAVTTRTVIVEEKQGPTLPSTPETSENATGSSTPITQ